MVYSKPPLAGPAKLLDYLSRYTHRVAISNERLVTHRDGQVTFRYRDRSDGDRQKLKTLRADQFIGRFLTHVLPDSFMRIRHYGFMSNQNRTAKLAVIRQLLGARAPQPLTTGSTGGLGAVLLQIKSPLLAPRYPGRSGIRFFDPNRARTRAAGRYSYSYSNPRDSKERDAPQR